MSRKMDNAIMIDLRNNQELVEQVSKILKIKDEHKTVVVRLSKTRFAIIKFMGNTNELDLRNLKCSKLVEDKAIVHPNKETLKKLEAKIKWDKTLEVELPYYILTMNERQVIRMAELNESIITDNANIDKAVYVKSIKGDGTKVELDDPYFVITPEGYFVQIGTKAEAREYVAKYEKYGKLIVTEAPLNQKFLDEVEDRPDILGEFIHAREEFLHTKQQLGL